MPVFLLLYRGGATEKQYASSRKDIEARCTSSEAIIVPFRKFRDWAWDSSNGWQYTKLEEELAARLVVAHAHTELALEYRRYLGFGVSAGSILPQKG